MLSQMRVITPLSANTGLLIAIQKTRRFIVTAGDSLSVQESWRSLAHQYLSASYVLQRKSRHKEALENTVFTKELPYMEL
jgi:hypothetical protein